MSNAREMTVKSLKHLDFDVQGAVLRAWYDEDDTLVFVVDFYTCPTKPNVWLVMDGVENRKWDDILVNDYGVDLEMVRPRKDNKYQKLDIEYSGLSVYDDLFRAIKNNKDLTNALDVLDGFRRKTAARVATERMDEAELIAERARDTIYKTNQTIAELQERLKELRSKLGQHKRKVGKEPTKQSAAKILRTESQIDAIVEKIERARKRLDSAQRRLVSSEDDIETANAVLGMLQQESVTKTESLRTDADTSVRFVPVFDDSVNKGDGTVDGALPMFAPNSDVAVVDMPPVPMAQITENINFEENIQKQKAKDMADEDVKPLFDKDPDIMDNENAFKPIDFDAPTLLADEKSSMYMDADVKPEQPLVFEPPIVESVQNTEGPKEPVDVGPVPVLDSIKSVATPVEQIDSELLGVEKYAENAPVVDSGAQYMQNNAHDVVSQDVTPVSDYSSVPDIEVVRPASPMAAAPVDVSLDSAPRKPTAIYYVLLVLLIALSVFTLWMYQGSTPDVLPELGASAKVGAVEETISESTATNGADMQTETVANQIKDVDITQITVAEPSVQEAEVVEMPQVISTLEKDTVIVPDIEPDVVTITENPVEIPDIEPESVQVTPELQEPVMSDSPFLTQDSVQPAEIKPIAEIIASKPVYNVSQQEKMFVADSEYETDDVPDVVVNTVESDMSSMPTVEYSQPTVVSKPVMPSQPVVTEPVMEYQEPMAVTQQEYFEEEVVDACADGSAPDGNGCCPGENYVNVVGAGYACCVESTGECFPPMK